MISIDKFKFENALKFIKLRVDTLKTKNLIKKNQFIFLVNKKLNKNQIKKIIEEIYEITVTSVNTCTLPVKFKKVGKYSGKITRYKKAYISIKRGNFLKFHKDFL